MQLIGCVTVIKEGRGFDGLGEGNGIAATDPIGLTLADFDRCANRDE